MPHSVLGLLGDWEVIQIGVHLPPQWQVTTKSPTAMLDGNPPLLEALYLLGLQLRFRAVRKLNSTLSQDCIGVSPIDKLVQLNS